MKKNILRGLNKKNDNKLVYKNKDEILQLRWEKDDIVNKQIY